LAIKTGAAAGLLPQPVCGQSLSLRIPRPSRLGLRGSNGLVLERASTGFDSRDGDFRQVRDKFAHRKALVGLPK